MKKIWDGTTLVNLRIVMCVLILLNEREVYSMLLSVVGRCTFQNRQNCWERSWTYMMESCCLFTVLTKFLDWLFSASLQSWVKRIESISLQSLKQRRMGTSPVKSFELFFALSCFSLTASVEWQVADTKQKELKRKLVKFYCWDYLNHKTLLFVTHMSFQGYDRVFHVIFKILLF